MKKSSLKILFNTIKNSFKKEIFYAFEDIKRTKAFSKNNSIALSTCSNVAISNKEQNYHNPLLKHQNSQRSWNESSKNVKTLDKGMVINKILDGDDISSSVSILSVNNRVNVMKEHRKKLLFDTPSNKQGSENSSYYSNRNVWKVSSLL